MAKPPQAVEAENRKLKEQLHHTQAANKHSEKKPGSPARSIFLLVMFIVVILIIWYILSLFRK